MIPAFLLEYKIHCQIFRFKSKSARLRLLTFILLFAFFSGAAQLPFNEEQFMARVKTGSTFPEQLLSTRTAVFVPYFFSSKSLEQIQLSFQKSGIDAVIYLDADF